MGCSDTPHSRDGLPPLSHVLESVEELENTCNFPTESHANDVNTVEDQTCNTNTKPSNEDENHETHENSKPKRRHRPEL